MELLSFHFLYGYFLACLMKLALWCRPEYRFGRLACALLFFCMSFCDIRGSDDALAVCPNVNDIRMERLDSERCFGLIPKMTGDDAWSKCPAQRKEILTENWKRITEAARERLPGEAALWIGYRQMYPGSSEFIGVDRALWPNSSELKSSRPDFTQQCLALDLAAGTTSSVSYSCQDILHGICVQDDKILAYNGTQICTDLNAVTLLPTGGCHKIANGSHCADGSNSIVTTIKSRPRVYIPASGSIMTTSGSLKFCPSTEGPRNKAEVYLKLEPNTTAGGLTLRIFNIDRSVWPVYCPGYGSPSGYADSLQLKPRKTSESAIWCYVRDIVTGRTVISNTQCFPALPDISTCKPSKSTYSDLNVASVPPANSSAFCFRCLNESTKAAEGTLESPHCQLNLSRDPTMTSASTPDRRVRNFFLECRQDWERAINTTLKRSLCSSDKCDCDAIAQELFGSEYCSSAIGNRYWRCRRDPRGETVAFPTGSYRCIPDFDRNIWVAIDLKFNEDSLTTFSPEDVKRAYEYLLEAVSEAKKISSSTGEFPADSNTRQLNEATVMKAMVGASILLQDDSNEQQQEITDKQPPIPILVEKVLSAASEVNVTLSNLAAVKVTSGASEDSLMGLALISMDAVTATSRTTFGANAVSLSLYREEDISAMAEKIEAAVILSSEQKNLTYTFVTYANGEDFLKGVKPAAECNTSIGDESADGQNGSSSEEEGREVPLLEGCLNSRVVSFVLEGEKGSDTQLQRAGYVDVYFRPSSESLPGEESLCVHWVPETGRWSSDGCHMLPSAGALAGARGLDTCRCTHFTHFALLVTDGALANGPHAECLHWLSISCCSASLLCLAVIFLTGAVSRQWRKRPENKVLLNLSAAVALCMSMFLWAALAPPGQGSMPGQWCAQAPPPPPSIECRVRGAFLHYGVVASFCWMLAAAVTQYLRFTKFIGPDAVPYFLTIATSLCWGTPLIPVAAVLAIGTLLCLREAAYVGAARDMCYPSGAAFYGGVMAPIQLALLCNLIAFILILRRLFPNACGGTGERLITNKNEHRVLLRKALICVAFTFLFGLTWILGLLAYTPMLAYLFCASATLQGVILFLFFVLGDRRIRQWVASNWRRHYQMSSSSGDSTSFSTLNRNNKGSNNSNSHPRKFNNKYREKY